MFEIGSKVEIKLLDVIGEVVEADETSVLVKHAIKVEEVTRIIEQWYDKEICTEVE